MNVRKSVFVVVGLLLTLGWLGTLDRHQMMTTPTPSKIADGGAPLPPIPKGTAKLYADGGAPLPPIPRGTGKLYAA
jgi:hypothetical protein